LKKTLPFFSYLFHPIFIPTMGTVFYIFYGENYFAQENFALLLFQVIIITFFLPLAFFYLLKTVGKVDTVMISDVSQRKMPLLLQIMLTLVLITKSVTIDVFNELFFFFLGGIISAAMAFILIYFKTKASIHMIAISAFTYFAIGLSIHLGKNMILFISLLFLLSGVIASSRLYMKAHSVKELAIGYLCGMLPQIGLYYFWL
jgi:hypothetical protein